MDGQFPWDLALVLGLAFIASYLFTWLARIYAPRLGFVDKPDNGRKCHQRVTPLMGGAAVFAAIVVSVFVVAAWQGNGELDYWQVLRIGSSGLLFCLLGLIDDKIVLRPRTKFFGQLVAALPFSLGTNPIEGIEVLGVNLPLGAALGTILIVFWLTACSNIVNLIDGLDGLASSIGIVAAVAFSVLSLMVGQTTIAFLSLAVAGSLLGFLLHNWPPARIFLGDAGSLTIGYLVGALALEASLKKTAVYTLTLPIVVLSVPAFDTFMAIVRRRLSGRGIGEGDRGHIHHRLQDQGMTKLQTLLAIAGLSCFMAASAILATRFNNHLIAVAGCACVLSLVIVSRLFGFYEVQLVFRHAQAVNELVFEGINSVGTRFLLVRTQAVDEQQRHKLWQEACGRLSHLGCTSIEVTARRAARESKTLQRFWEDKTASHQSGGQWNLRYEVEHQNGWHFVVIGNGNLTVQNQLPHADDLFRIFHGICQYIQDVEDEKVAASLPLEIVPLSVVNEVASKSDRDDQSRRAA